MVVLPDAQRVRSMIREIRVRGDGRQDMGLIAEAVRSTQDLVNTHGSILVRQILGNDYSYITLVEARAHCAQHLVIAVSDFAGMGYEKLLENKDHVIHVTERAIDNPYIDFTDRNYHQGQYESFINSSRYWALLLLTKARGDKLNVYNERWTKEENSYYTTHIEENPKQQEYLMLSRESEGIWITTVSKSGGLTKVRCEYPGGMLKQHGFGQLVHVVEFTGKGTYSNAPDNIPST